MTSIFFWGGPKNYGIDMPYPYRIGPQFQDQLKVWIVFSSFPMNRDMIWLDSLEGEKKSKQKPSCVISCHLNWQYIFCVFLGEIWRRMTDTSSVVSLEVAVAIPPSNDVDLFAHCAGGRLLRICGILHQPKQLESEKIPSLKLTAKAPENGSLEYYFPFWDGLFSGAIVIC